jgi:signal transduction histidine kinase
MSDPVPADDGRALLAAGDAARARGEHRVGAGLARQALAAADARGDADLAANAQALLALLLVRLGDVEGAVASGQRALAQWAAGPPTAALSRLHSNLSLAFERVGLHTLAVQHAASALDIARTAQDTAAECWALNRLGTAIGDGGSGDGAGDDDGLSLLEEALDLARRLPGPTETFAALNNLARRWMVRADRLSGADARLALQQALPMAEAAMAIAESSMPGFALATAAANLGGLHQRLADPGQAAAHYGHALALSRREGYTGLAATVELALAGLDMSIDPTPQARAALADQLARADAGVDPDLRLQVRRGLVDACSAAGDLDGALAQLERLHAEAMADQARRSDLQTRLLIHRTELEQARHAAERARLDAELERVRADAEHRSAQQLALDRDLLEHAVAARTAELVRAKAVAEAANRARSAFLSIVSHELRTPLNGMLGMVELARRRAVDARQSDQLAAAVASGRHLNGLFDHILNYVAADTQAPPAAGDADVPALLEGLRQTWQPVAQARGLALALQVDPALPGPMPVDGHQLGQILEVLVDNAIKFTSQGRVLLRAGWEPAGDRPAHLRLEVADTGPGLSADMQARLFRPFELGDPSSTRRHGGLGLGLALAQRLAQGMGGQIGVDNHAPDGCTFWVSVPVPDGSTALTA